MNRVEELAEKMDMLARELDPYDYEGSPEDHMDILLNDPLEVVSQLIDIANELLK